MRTQREDLLHHINFTLDSFASYLRKCADYCEGIDLTETDYDQLEEYHKRLLKADQLLGRFGGCIVTNDEDWGIVI